MAKDRVAWQVRDFIGVAILIVAVGALVYQNAWRLSAPFLEITEVQPVHQIVKEGDPVTLVYTTRRNSTCPTTVEFRFSNARTGAYIVGDFPVIRSTQAPITEGFVEFPVEISTEGLGPGRYSYHPLLTCEDTGDQMEPPPASFTIE